MTLNLGRIFPILIGFGLFCSFFNLEKFSVNSQFGKRIVALVQLKMHLKLHRKLNQYFHVKNFILRKNTRNMLLVDFRDR